MYEVQVYIPTMPLDPEGPACWVEHTVVGQLDTEQAEFQKARSIRAELKKFYNRVRIIKWNPGGESGRAVT